MNTEVDQLKARLEKAEACAAEMRLHAQVIADWIDNEGPPARDWKTITIANANLQHALSTDCGVGWLSPEKGKMLVDLVTRLRMAVMHDPYTEDERCATDAKQLPLVRECDKALAAVKGEQK